MMEAPLFIKCEPGYLPTVVPSSCPEPERQTLPLIQLVKVKNEPADLYGDQEGTSEAVKQEPGWLPPLLELVKIKTEPVDSFDYDRDTGEGSLEAVKREPGSLPPLLELVKIKLEPVDDSPDHDLGEGSSEAVDQNFKEENTKEGIPEESLDGMPCPMDLSECCMVNIEVKDENLLVPQTDAVSEELPINCYFCGETFKNVVLLHEHLSVHNGEANIPPIVVQELEVSEKVCDKCGVVFTSRLHLSLNDDSSQGELLCPKCSQEMSECQCPVCGKQFAKEDSPQGQLLCPTCNRKTLECSVCCRQFTNELDLETHKSTHLGLKPLVAIAGLKGKIHSCPICGDMFMTKTSLKAHKAKHKTFKPFQCNVCKKSFATKARRAHHMKRHTTANTHSCHLCPATFVNGADLIHHSFTHSGFKVYNCQSCKRQFKNLYQLAEHRLYHKGKRDYACRFCYRTFEEERELLVHQSIHKD